MAAELMRQSHALGASVDLAVIDVPGAMPGTIDDAVGSFAATFSLGCRGQFDASTIRQLRHVLSDRRIDVVHSHKYKATFYAALARPRRQVQLVTTYHNWLGNTRALRLYAALDKRLARFNDMCVGVSSTVVAELRRYVPAGRVRQIDNGIDLTRYSPPDDRADAKVRAGFASNLPLIGFVGRLSPEKGLEFLLDALAALNSDGCQAAIVGDGELAPSVREWIAARGLGERVRMLGNRRDTGDLYRAFDLFVLPSTTEAFPMVLLEAMASGCPVVATAVGEVERIVVPGVTGYVVAPGRADELHRAIRTLLADPALRSRFGAAGRARALETFSSLRMAKSYLSVYNDVLRARVAHAAPISGN